MRARCALLLGAESQRITVPVARSLRRLGVRVIVAALSASEHPTHSRAVAAEYRLPERLSDSEGWLAAVLGIIADEHVDTVIPLSDAALALVARHDAALRSKVTLACPPPHIVSRVLDKEVTVALAAEAGIPQPKSAIAPDIDTVRELARTATFPLIAKPLHKTEGRRPVDFKVAYFRTPDELVDACIADPRIPPNVLFQEYVPGDGLLYAAFVADGRVTVRFQHRRITELPAGGGVGVLLETEAPDPRISDAVDAILNAIEWDGPCSVEFRHDRATDRYWLLEVNGRYWGSLGAALAVGLDVPAYHWKYLHGEAPALLGTYPARVRCIWAVGEILRLRRLSESHGADGLGRFSLPREAMRFLAHLRPGIHHALWRLDDPQPALRELGRALRGTARRMMQPRRRLAPVGDVS